MKLSSWMVAAALIAVSGPVAVGSNASSPPVGGEITDSQVSAFLALNPHFKLDATAQGVGELLRTGWVSYYQAEFCQKYWDIGLMVIPDIKLRLGILERATVETGVTSQASMDQFREEVRASILSPGQIENADYSARQNKDRMCEGLSLWINALAMELDFGVDRQELPQLR